MAITTHGIVRTNNSHRSYQYRRFFRKTGLRYALTLLLCIGILSSSLVMFPSPVLAASISIDPTSGPTGTVITVTGSGFAASTYGYIFFDTDGDDTRDSGEPYQFKQTTSAGDLPAGVTFTVPATSSGTYDIIANIPTSAPYVDASTPFVVTVGAPSISLNPTSGITGTVITVTGSGFNASAGGYIWFDTDGDSIMDTEEPQTPVTSTVNGTIPSGTTLTAPVMGPLISYVVRADIPEGDTVEAQGNFSNTSSATPWLTVTKYDAYGNVLDAHTITYTEMESTLPVQGDGNTHYYHQGPTFDNADFSTVWDPMESVNVESRDMGRPMGTDVKDLCDLVGGAAPGDTIKIKASDNFAKWFDYEDIYEPEPEQGKLVVCWYNADFGGYVPAYDSGMRLIFFADTSVNPWTWHVFGDWDEHETLPESRRHYYSAGSGVFWPSSSGISVQCVYNIEIHQPNLISCDAAGNAKDAFSAGETVYVKGVGLAQSQNYDIWIQPEPVSNNKLQTIDGYDPILAPAYVFYAGNDPSSTQEVVVTNASGDFGPTAIWTTDYSVTNGDYDIVADRQGAGTSGTYDISYDYIDNPGWKGFTVTAISEFISFTITDYNNDGIKFGQLVQGDIDQPADSSGSQGAITITVGIETNVDVDIQVMATDFTGPSGTIPIGNVKYNDIEDPETASILTGTYVTWYTVEVPLGTDDVIQVYYWLSIPPDLPDGDYNSTFYYKAVTSSP